jgi:hypothetical protein
VADIFFSYSLKDKERVGLVRNALAEMGFEVFWDQETPSGSEHGATTKELASVSGHKTLTEVERYVAQADQRKLSASAIAKLTEDKK